VRIEVVDPCGGGLGLAIGLVQLGHTVAHRGPSSWVAGAPWPTNCSRELQQRFCGAWSSSAPEPDLLILVDVFADYLRALELGIGVRPGAVVHDPLQDGAGTLVYPDRLEWFCRRAQSAQQVAVVDLSDAASPREIAFTALPHATLLARECPASGDGPWRPFPFLYNHVLLWLELLRPASEWWLPGDARRRDSDWAFCGTVDHPRYGDRRRHALDELARRWPSLRGCVETSLPFAEIVRVWQQVGFGVDLPGAGELCYRLHECLALGTPVVRPFPTNIALPRALRGVVVDSPEHLASQSPEDVRAIYERHYAPRAAATWLLATVAAANPPVAGHR
jgi:hypothetical protein